mmetsp:Transcript_20409/g.29092  ORF Transcript_20409/g.29092 Transcript_20409/m.29092 type:complete len:212 (+) Transcript_20409:152-787(+)
MSTRMANPSIVYHSPAAPISSSSVVDLKVSSSKQIRTRLLLNLGISANSSASAATSSNENTSRRSCLVNGTPFVEPLKYNRLCDDHDATPSSSPTSTAVDIANVGCPRIKKCRKTKSAISFDEFVSVLHIPHHEAYSDRIRSRVWSDRVEIMSNVRRNTIEFAAEGWDWRNVVEDEMLRHCPTTGERVHPVHRFPDRPQLTRGSSIFEASS